MPASNASNVLNDQVQALANVTDKPSLFGLSYALRHPETWPIGFVWDYRDCQTCAVGLAVQLWKLIGVPVAFDWDDECMTDAQKSSVVSPMARIFAIGYSTAHHIFFNVQPRRSLILRRPIGDLKDVTPDMVADEIDRYLATKA